MSAPSASPSYRYVQMIQTLPTEPRRRPQHYRPQLPHERHRQAIGLVLLAVIAAIGAVLSLAMDADGWGGVAGVVLGLSVPVKLYFALRMAN